MGFQDLVLSIENAYHAFSDTTRGVAPQVVKIRVTKELQEMEVAQIRQGANLHTARAASWKRVKALHGLGCPVDFDWLHTPSSEPAAPSRP